MNILSLQSEVVYGHVGQRAARFALERLGHTVWSMPTVILSNHTGYAKVEGETVGADLLRKLSAGLDANGWLTGCDAILSGYLGSATQADVLAEIVRKVKRAKPRAIYCLDPVFGDAGRAYAKPGVAEAMARTLLPLADIVTPNAFELSSLTSVPTRDSEEALAAARRLSRPVVAGTSIPDGADRIGTLVVEKDEAWFATTPLLGNVPHGAGDLFAALFLAAKLEGHSLHDCVLRSTASVFVVLEKSVAAGSAEMLLVKAQDVLLDPPARDDIYVKRMG
jgi:pyridoxine kinase